MQKINFDLGWEYSEVSGLEAIFNPGVWQPVILPHDAMIGKPRAANNPSGNQGGFFPGGVANYRKKFMAPEEWRGQSIKLEFEGVYMNAEVSINNQLILIQPYGYSSFIVDLSPYLVYGQENTIGVVANNTAQPNSRWYTGTGIYRHVWLHSGGPVHIQPWGVFVTTPVAETEVSVIQAATEISGLNNLDNVWLRSTILDARGALVIQTETAVKLAAIQQTLLVKEAKLWSLLEPNLYTLVSELVVNDTVVDTQKTIFGIRSISVDAERGFRLNGMPLKMRGGCIHHDHGPLGAASYDRAEERKIELLKSAGYNAIRCAHNPPAPALLDACDRLGFLVIDETFGAWTSPKVPNDYHLCFREWWQRDTAAMIRRDRNHPSVILWSIGNEILEALGNPIGAEWSQRLADFVRSLDNTRFITSGVVMNFLEAIANHDMEGSFNLKAPPADPEKDSWGRMTAAFARPLDVVGYNYMGGRYETDQTRFPGRVIAGTETWGHKMYLSWKETERLPNVIGDFVWTSFDYIGEAGFGAVSFDGQPRMGAPYPYHLYGCGDFNICGFKRPQSYYRDLLWGLRTAPYIAVLDPQHHGKPISFVPWAWEPVLDTWTFPGQEGKLTSVDVYSIDDEVELFVNGASAGRKPAGAACQNKVRFDVTYQPGTIEAVGYCEGKETYRHRLVTASAPFALHLTSDRLSIQAGCGDLAYVTIEIQDQNGVVVKHGQALISVEVSGAGELVAVGSGDPLSEESYTVNQHKAYQGRLLAIVRSRVEAGNITVTVQAEGLPAATVNLESR